MGARPDDPGLTPRRRRRVPRPRHAPCSASSAASSPASSSASPPRSPCRSWTPACAARSSCGASTGCRSWPASRRSRAGADRPLEPLRLSPAAAEAYRRLRGTLAVAQRGGGGEPAGDPRDRLLALRGQDDHGDQPRFLARRRRQQRDPDRGRPAPPVDQPARSGSTPSSGVVSVLIESVDLEDALRHRRAVRPELRSAAGRLRGRLDQPSSSPSPPRRR